eukprot:scaffold112866_cov19-Prasinocladus_malaysianus.AAC.1
MTVQVEATALCQALASAVPGLYSALSDLDGSQMEVAREMLGDSRCIWVGNGFQKPSKVLFFFPLPLFIRSSNAVCTYDFSCRPAQSD